MEDDGGAGPLPNFIGSGQLDEAAASRRRAPADKRPFDDGEDDTFCFASRYTPGDEGDPTDLGSEQLREAFRQMNAIIDKHYGTNTSMEDLVTAVYDFYEENIRREFDYGNWSKKSIYNYIISHSAGAEDRQASEGIKLLWTNVELLREHVAVEDPQTGKVTPDLRVMKALQDSLKLHAALLDARRKRPRAAQ
jgi:hypothetical protein